MAGRPPGAVNRDKPYREALRMELAAAGEDMKALRAIARAHIAKATEGDMQAIVAMADRLDGKPAQALVGGDDEDNPIKVIQEIRRSIVDPRHTDSKGVPPAA